MAQHSSERCFVSFFVSDDETQNPPIGPGTVRRWTLQSPENRWAIFVERRWQIQTASIFVLRI